MPLDQFPVIQRDGAAFDSRLPQDVDYGTQAARDAAREVAGFSHLDEDSIPSKKDPKENAKWWASLSPQEREEYIDAYPDRIGWLDGTPSADRDEATRKRWISNSPSTT
ncbi:hypothetical protein [Streptomyces sp. NPDC048196]|uniref:hypothetical protein n=1 Tax=Streptomyces sp. NPDC048196 TaxID=3154712 RepID=UPI00340300AC